MLFGCAPGGGISNIIVYWIGGDVDLSVTMTMVSCILSLGLTPLWLLAVPRLISFDAEIADHIPYSDISVNLAAVVIPACLGSLIYWLCERYEHPNIAKYSAFMLSIVYAIVMFVMLGMAVYKFNHTAIVTTAQIGHAALTPLIVYSLAHMVSWLIGSTIAQSFAFREVILVYK